MDIDEVRAEIFLGNREIRRSMKLCEYCGKRFTVRGLPVHERNCALGEKSF